MSLPLLGKVSLISQGFTSVGASVAKRFAADGSNVVLLHTSATRSNAEVLAKAINARKVGIALLAEVDFSALSASSGNPAPARGPDDMDADNEEPSTNDKLSETLRMLGRVDVLVHAGEDVVARSLVEVNEELFDDMLEYHVKHPLFLTKLVAPHMREGGRIIFFSSFCTKVTAILPQGLLYAGFKGAVEQMTRVLAKDLGQRGITVNAVSLGPIDTPVFRAGKSPEDVKKIKTLSPGNRLAFVDEIVPMVRFLATDEAGWVNGQILPVNGGYVV